MRLRLRSMVLIGVTAMMATAVVACGGDEETLPPSTSTTSMTTPTTTSSTTSSTTTSTSTSSTTSTSTTTPEPEPTDPLTGGVLSKRPVLAVKIDNTHFPQFGITAADIVYVEQVEGGLTRLIAMFHTKLPEEVGPVRSIRSTDMQLLPSFGDPLVIGSGGARAQLTRLRNSGLPNVLYDYGAAGMWRSNAASAPYNVHANLKDIAKAHPKVGKARPMGFEFDADDARLSSARTVDSIDVTMLAARFTFDYVKGKYRAHHSGAPYVDQNGKAVKVDNVLVQHVTNEPDGTIDPAGNPSFLTHTVGKGTFTLYRNGVAIDGTWSRKKVDDPTSFADKDGNPVTLSPGKTWVLLAPQTSTVNKG